MPIATRLTECLGITHPILLAPMDRVADATLATAVSAAGGLGMLGGGYGDAAWLRAEIAASAGARIGIGFITWSLAKQPELLAIALAAKPAAIMLSFGDPAPFAEAIHAAGARLVCQVQSLDGARAAVAAGADILVAQGSEAGGHGASRGTMALVPAIADAAPEVPLAAAGGIADGRGLAAALMLGADGVLVGSRFHATLEAAAPMAAKARLVTAVGDGTIRSILFDIARRNVWPAPYTGRVLRNAFSERWQGREAELLQHQADEAARYEAARVAGDYDTAAVIAGEAVDLIGDIPPAGEVVARMMREAEVLVAGASNRLRLGG